MKAKMLGTYLAVLAILGLLVAVGFVRGIELSKAVAAAYSNESVDQYVGHDVPVSPDQCAKAAKAIKASIAASAGPALLQTDLAAFSPTFKANQPTLQSFVHFKQSTVVSKADITLDDNSASAVQNKVSTSLGLSIDSIIEDETRQRAATILDKEIQSLQDANQLPESIDTTSWPSAFEEKFKKVCSSDIKPAVQSVAASYNANLKKYSSLVLAVLSADWQPNGYTKIAPLLAYKTWPGGSCVGASYLQDCATFKLIAAAACNATVSVDFTDSASNYTGDAKKSVHLNSPNSPVNVVAISSNSYNASYYDITGAKCK